MSVKLVGRSKSQGREIRCWMGGRHKKGCNGGRGARKTANLRLGPTKGYVGGSVVSGREPANEVPEDGVEVRIGQGVPIGGI